MVTLMSGVRVTWPVGSAPKGYCLGCLAARADSGAGQLFRHGVLAKARPRAGQVGTIMAVSIPNSGYKCSKNQSERPDLNRRPLDPQEVVWRLSRSVLLCRGVLGVLTCELFIRVHTVWSQSGPNPCRERVPRQARGWTERVARGNTVADRYLIDADLFPRYVRGDWRRGGF